MTADEIIRLLALEPLPGEGGYFKSSYRSPDVLPTSALPERYCGPRQLGSAIYYLLVAGVCSRLHRLSTDELFHFYMGDPVRLLLLFPDGTSDLIELGHDIANGQCLQALVPRGCWQGAFVRDGGSFALLGATMCPGFDYDDYQQGDRKTLIGQYPQCRELILQLTDES